MRGESHVKFGWRWRSAEAAAGGMQTPFGLLVTSPFRSGKNLFSYQSHSAFHSTPPPPTAPSLNAHRSPSPSVRELGIME